MEPLEFRYTPNIDYLVELNEKETKAVLACSQKHHLSIIEAYALLSNQGIVRSPFAFPYHIWSAEWNDIFINHREISDYDGYEDITQILTEEDDE